MYTYQDLLEETAAEKKRITKQLNDALKGAGGFLVKAEIEKNPGMCAWLWLAKGFCEKLAEHVSEWISDADGNFDVNNPDAEEIGRIYMADEDSDPDLYEMLPVEARLFDKEG